MSYVFFALLAALSYAFATLIAKGMSKHSIKRWDSLAAYYILTYNHWPILIPLIVGQVTWPGPAIGAIIVNSFFFIVGLVFFFLAFTKIDASVMTALYQIQGAAIVVLAFIFLGERFNPSTYIWILILLIGTMLVSIDEHLSLKSFFISSIFLGIAAMILFSVSNLGAGIAVRHTSYWNVVFWTGVLNYIFIAIFIGLKRPLLNFPLKKIVPLLGSGIFQFTGSISALFAFQQNLTISSVLVMLESPIVFVVAVLSSHFFPQLLEHHTPKVYAVRGIGLLIILIAAVTLSLNK